MIRNCPNCASKVVFDASLGALSCDRCGGIYDVEEFDAKYAIPEEEDLLPSDDPQRKADDDLFREAHKRMIDVNVYTCSSCGADVIVSNTEASTFCVYCGNPNIVFSRIRKISRPDAIIPFSIPKEAAEGIIRGRLKKGLFVPSAIKRFKTESIVGVYIPYHINDIIYRDTISVEYYYDDQKTKNSRPTRHLYNMSGQCHFDRLTTDACMNLNNELSYRVEPYNIEEIVPFEDDYLLGFYSDIPDVDYDDAFIHASHKARDVAYQDVFNKIEGTRKKIISSHPSTEMVSEPLLALFPMWFLTYKYKGEQYTCVVNGQTGKVVAGVPLAKYKFAIFSTVLAIVTIALGLIASLTLSITEPVYLIYLAIFAIGQLGIGIAEFERARKSVMRSKSSITRMYATNRQKGQ
ncbi:MAG: hypothetical protein MJ166_06190 [Clostridia bacterium]|nr:hypothetical protein [Clostridia bacterium]